MTMKRKIPQHRPNFKSLNLERNRVIYSRNLAGESHRYLAEVYKLSHNRIGTICRAYKAWIKAGYVKPVKKNENVEAYANK